MSNTNSAFGLRPVRRLGGAPMHGAITPYWVRSDYATSLFINDPVVVSGASDTYQGETLPNVVLATAGASNQITGSIVGFEPNPSVVSLGYGLASTQRKVYVCDAPDVLFEIQEDGLVTPIATASIGLNANLISGSGSVYHKKSGWLLDSDSVGSDATYQLTVRSLVQRPDNEAATAYAKYLVSINLHTNRLGALAGL